MISHCNFSIASVRMVLAHRFTYKRKSKYFCVRYHILTILFFLKGIAPMFVVTHPSLKSASQNDFTLACFWNLAIRMALYLWWTQVHYKRKMYEFFSFLRSSQLLHCLVDSPESCTSGWMSGVKIRLQAWPLKIHTTAGITRLAELRDIACSTEQKGQHLHLQFS